MQMSVVTKVGSMRYLKLGEDPANSGFYISDPEDTVKLHCEFLTESTSCS